MTIQDKKRRQNYANEMRASVVVETDIPVLSRKSWRIAALRISDLMVTINSMFNGYDFLNPKLNGKNFEHSVKFEDGDVISFNVVKK